MNAYVDADGMPVPDQSGDSREKKERGKPRSTGVGGDKRAAKAISEGSDAGFTVPYGKSMAFDTLNPLTAMFGGRPLV